MTKKTSEGLCEMCGHFVKIRQKAHIVAEGKKSGDNLLMLCPSCHIIFDTHVKPKIYKSLKQAGCKNLPNSWEKSIYQQAAQASQAARKKKEGNAE
ncbi:MAG: HNH endonuclease [Deltaproteobacteria bacterium]|nr:HNH endonuclease [Deltaproteobacteria bacterium]MBW2090340.1 HNH endonuclease [Deltaproteobacteria bacterium]